MANLTQMTIISTTMGKNPFEKNGIALLFNKRVWKEVLGCSLKNYRMISVHSKANCFNNKISSVQSSLSVMSNALRPHESQHARPPVHHQLLEFTQTHIHRVSDAIQPSHPLSSPSPLPPIPPSIRVFSNELTLDMRWPKYWSFSFSIIPPKITQSWSPLEWTAWISLQSKGLARVFSSTTVQKHQLFGAHLYSSTLTSIHDHWKNNSLD